MPTLEVFVAKGQAQHSAQVISERIDSFGSFGSSSMCVLLNQESGILENQSLRSTTNPVKILMADSVENAYHSRFQDT